MLKRSSLLALGFAALAAPWLSVPAAATNINGLSPNGTFNGMSPSGITSNFMTLQTVRLALPDGTEFTFR